MEKKYSPALMGRWIEVEKPMLPYGPDSLANKALKFLMFTQGADVVAVHEYSQKQIKSDLHLPEDVYTTEIKPKFPNGGETDWILKIKNNNKEEIVVIEVFEHADFSKFRREKRIKQLDTGVKFANLVAGTVVKRGWIVDGPHAGKIKESLLRDEQVRKAVDAGDIVIDAFVANSKEIELTTGDIQVKESASMTESSAADETSVKVVRHGRDKWVPFSVELGTVRQLVEGLQEFDFQVGAVYESDSRKRIGKKLSDSDPLPLFVVVEPPE
eukprot:TRINITY_DN53670_c0_g1_i1.p1 TRINITY_DN53670_c0_g1~~TRINITY_DN53670_c0_g1_i1.p1  ORF type:complete len:278 (-),score=26.37 TRINITY_DN53670_c0_g1_i1:68-877(-)